MRSFFLLLRTWDCRNSPPRRPGEWRWRRARASSRTWRRRVRPGWRRCCLPPFRGGWKRQGRPWPGGRSGSPRGRLSGGRGALRRGHPRRPERSSTGTGCLMDTAGGIDALGIGWTGCPRRGRPVLRPLPARGRTAVPPERCRWWVSLISPPRSQTAPKWPRPVPGWRCRWGSGCRRRRPGGCLRRRPTGGRAWPTPRPCRCR